MSSQPQQVSIDQATGPSGLRSPADAPLVLDTDIGGDPDDAVTLAVAALRVPQLALVTTTDERDGQCARFARALLDQLGRPEVPVAAGPSLDPPRRLFVTGLIPDTVPAQPTNVTTAVAAVLEQTNGPVRWLGCGPLTNLAQLLRERPGVAGRLVATQMGGAFNYRRPDRGEHNFRRDIAAVDTVLATARLSTLVISDLTFTPELLVTTASPLYWQLTARQVPGWARLLCGHLDQWITNSGHQGSRMHDPVTLSVALNLPFVRLAAELVAIDQLGRMRRDPNGAEVLYSRTCDYPAFRRWLADALTVHAATAQSGTPALTVGGTQPDRQVED